MYYSASGNTERVAKAIADAAGADIFELTPVDEYTSADLDWTTDGSRVNREHDDESLRDIALTTTDVPDWDEYDTVLTDYTIGAFDQSLPDDGLGEVISAMEAADTIVIGSPVYWHNICGSVRNVLDRFYGTVDNGALAGRTLYFVFQGGAPEKWMLDAGEYTMKRFAALYGMSYGGMVSSRSQAKNFLS